MVDAVHISQLHKECKYFVALIGFQSSRPTS